MVRGLLRASHTPPSPRLSQVPMDTVITLTELAIALALLWPIWSGVVGRARGLITDASRPVP